MFHSWSEVHFPQNPLKCNKKCLEACFASVKSECLKNVSQMYFAWFVFFHIFVSLFSLFLFLTRKNKNLQPKLGHGSETPGLRHSRSQSSTLLPQIGTWVWDCLSEIVTISDHNSPTTDTRAWVWDLPSEIVTLSDHIARTPERAWGAWSEIATISDQHSRPRTRSWIWDP